MRGLLEEFWENQEVVTRQNVYHGSQFRVTHGTTQGGVTLPILFNMAVNSVILHWLLLMVEDKVVIHDGLGHAVVLRRWWYPGLTRFGVAAGVIKRPHHTVSADRIGGQRC